MIVPQNSKPAAVISSVQVPENSKPADVISSVQGLREGGLRIHRSVDAGF